MFTSVNKVEAIKRVYSKTNINYPVGKYKKKIETQEKILIKFLLFLNISKAVL